MDTEKEFDVFLCHNSEDKDVVTEIGNRLRLCGINPWLDIWNLRPGIDLQDALGEEIANIQTVAVFIGSAGIGSWQGEEIKFFIREFIERDCLVFPVLLESAPDELELPPLLAGKTWVDFRSSIPDPLEQLVWGITSKKPSITHQAVRSGKTQIESGGYELPARKEEVIAEELLELERHLQRDEWLLADKLTANLLTHQADLLSEHTCLFDEASIVTNRMKSIACSTIVSIDRLWQENSGGKFGFSVQKDIYQSMTRSCVFEHISIHSLGSELGWYIQDICRWIRRSELISDKDKAPAGHFPWMICHDKRVVKTDYSRVNNNLKIKRVIFVMESMENMSKLFARLDDCYGVSRG
ncbi:hypothetical protein S7335_820 [Synechococcus sp. PCC 7335]|uniref:TIR domain-containing protein n=1 Tax=Synechococcus sp. (strain ATCC 29403 / PCC 7335) TaxID=91464 RepID=UPI00017EBCF3|nr:TIR domain-containing protein [Synechococcus sp. PCC 7335]EDX82374.1 hypothetical protein S7335_820 [Synechococcus sp. PCC 7335]